MAGPIEYLLPTWFALSLGLSLRPENKVKFSDGHHQDPLLGF